MLSKIKLSYTRSRSYFFIEPSFCEDAGGTEIFYSYTTITIVFLPLHVANLPVTYNPQYLFIVENYPHLIRKGMCASQKTVSIKMRLNFCSANLTLIDPT